MIKLFRDKSIIAILALVVWCFLVHFHIFFTPITIICGTNSGVLSWFLQNVLIKLHPIVLSIGYIILLLLQAIRLNFILDNSKMFNKPGFTIAFTYILLSGLFVNVYNISPAFISNIFVILLINSALKLYNNPTANKLLFNLGFLASISFILYQPSIVLAIALFFALGILRSFKPAEWFILIIGIVAPIYLLLAGLFLTNKLQVIYQFAPKLQFYLPIIKDPWYWYNLLIILLLTIAGLVVWYPNSNRLVIQIRKSWLVILILFLLSLLVIPVFKNVNYMPEILCIVSLSAFIANFFVYPKKTILINILVLAAIVAIVYNNFLFIPI